MQRDINGHMESVETGVSGLCRLVPAKIVFSPGGGPHVSQGHPSPGSCIPWLEDSQPGNIYHLTVLLGLWVKESLGLQALSVLPQCPSLNWEQ